MKDLIDANTLEKIALFMAIAGPLVGLIVGSMLGAHQRCSAPTIVAATLMGGLCTVTYGLWKLYGAITGALGLDSAANLILQLAMFAVFGCILGVAAYRLSALFRELNSRNPG